MEKLIEDIVKNNIPVTIKYAPQNASYYYEIEGFYKSGSVKLYKNLDKWECTARYDEVTIVENFDDLVYINYDWWYKSRNSLEGWQEPHTYWKQHLIDKKLITVETHTRFEYIPAHKS